MKSINWQVVGIVLLIIAAIVIVIYFTAIALFIFIITGGIIVPSWFKIKSWTKKQ